MDLNADNIIKIFEKNKLGKEIKTELGNAIEVNSYDAFIISCLTDTGYVVNKDFPEHFCSQLKIFNSALKYNIIAGIFNNQGILEFKNTPNEILNKYPFVNDKNKKKIIPIEFITEEEFRSCVKKVHSKTQTPNDFLLLRIDKSKKGYGLENLLEYFCSEYFKSLGYITETQIPLSHSDGVPDIGVYENFLSKEGFNLIELSMMKIFPNKIKFTKLKKELFNAYVGEAKAVSSYDIVKRLKKYMSTNFFSNSFGIYPDEKKKDLLLRNKIGIFFINKEFKFQFSEKKLVKNFNSKEIEKYADWFFNYVKFYLIANYKKENLDQFLSRRKIKKDGISKFITEVKKLSLEDLLDDYI